MVDVIRGEGVAAGRPFPATLPLGSDCFNAITAACEKSLANLTEWEDVITGTDFPKDK